MDIRGLKTQFGKDIVFWGGIDSQQLLPNGSVEDVETEVRHLIREAAPGGGLIICAVHNIQADVPPQNVLALYEAVHKWGKYPISPEI
jgi:uroporphyrinogen decarboxylase